MVNWETLKIKKYKDVTYCSLTDKIIYVSAFIGFLISIFGLFYINFIISDVSEKIIKLNYLFLVIFIITFLSPFGIYGIFKKEYFYDVIVELNLSESKELESLLSNKGFLLSKLNTKIEGNFLIVDLISGMAGNEFKYCFESAYFKIKDDKTHFVGKILCDRFDDFALNNKNGRTGENIFKDMIENKLKAFFERLNDMKSLDSFVLKSTEADSMIKSETLKIKEIEKSKKCELINSLFASIFSFIIIAALSYIISLAAFRGSNIHNFLKIFVPLFVISVIAACSVTYDTLTEKSYSICAEINLPNEFDLKNIFSNPGSLIKKIDTKFDGDTFVMYLSSITPYEFYSNFRGSSITFKKDKAYFKSQMHYDDFYAYYLNKDNSSNKGYKNFDELENILEENLKLAFEKLPEFKSMDELVSNSIIECPRS